jgi:hypothetical protein
MRSLCIVNLLSAINDIKPLSVTMETQEWGYFAMLYSYKILRTSINTVNVLKSSCKVPQILVRF